MSSLNYPATISLALHDLVEPQWFPKPRDEMESSVDGLERSENLHRSMLRNIVLPIRNEPMVVIGITGGTEEVKQLHSNVLYASTDYSYNTNQGSDDVDGNSDSANYGSNTNATAHNKNNGLQQLIIPPPPIHSFWEQYKHTTTNTHPNRDSDEQSDLERSSVASTTIPYFSYHSIRRPIPIPNSCDVDRNYTISRNCDSIDYEVDDDSEMMLSVDDD